MTILIDEVKPYLIDKLDLDLDQVGFPTSLNKLVAFDKEQNNTVNQKQLINEQI